MEAYLKGFKMIRGGSNGGIVLNRRHNKDKCVFISINGLCVSMARGIGGCISLFPYRR